MKKDDFLAKFEHDACGIGAIVSIDGKKTHSVVTDALAIVERLEHRAGKDASGTVGDGVGILTQIPHDFFAANAGIDLPEQGDYGVGTFFFPQCEKERIMAKKSFEIISGKEGVRIIGWRKVPTRKDILGEKALLSMPEIHQCFLARPNYIEKGKDFDRKLYVIRRQFEKSTSGTYVVSLSSRTIVYKGMLLVNQLRVFYPDLTDEKYRSAIAFVHSRFSTNTQPSWERAHPYRFIAHNGEINTIRGNADRMLAREETMSSKIMEEDMEKVLPVINASGSDSAMLDNTLEFMYMNGIDLPLAVMATIPEPWKHDPYAHEAKRDFYHYYATMMEPWDGPAAIMFSDGEIAGMTLDRNGLRPSRYFITDDNLFVLASETGVLDIPEEKIAEKSRIEPGKMIVIDTVGKKVIRDEECKRYYSEKNPYGEWLDDYLLKLKNIPVPNKKVVTHDQILRDKLYKAFGYTYEDIKDNILPMAKNGEEAIASMGTDIPLAALSEKHQPLFNYFKQLFAQVTNPPIDSLREKIVTDTTVYVGSDGNLLEEKGENCRVLEIEHPILTGVDLLKIKSLNKEHFKCATVSLLYYKNTSLKDALEEMFVNCDKAFRSGANIIVLSDRGLDESKLAIPSLLAVSAMEQYLVRTKKRTAVSIILESAEPRSVHHFATLLGYGARAVNPYLAHECIEELVEKKMLDKDPHTAIDDYNSAVMKGIVKIAAKMGISTLQSYQSAQIFEAVGIEKEVIDKYFTNTVSRVGGIGLKEIEDGVKYRHDHAFDPLGLGVDTALDSTGYYKLRSGKDKEDHLYNPQTIVKLQQAVREGSYEKFRQYTDLVDNEIPHTLRGLLDFEYPEKGVPIEEVESEESIVKRFKTGAMSYGSISEEAHECMAIAMNRLGGKSNSGEGGEKPERLGTEKNSKIKQVASGRFGVTSEYLVSAEEIQIKMAQGAKPGEGGHLPGKKVYPWIAKTRYSTPGVSLISPPPHHDIYSIEDLAQLIYDLKNAGPKARISVKLVSEAGVGTIAAGVAKAGAQVVLISGHDGGTGAAPYSSIHHAGLPWELGVAETHRTLIENGLRNKVIVETDGKLMSGRDVVIAALLGAEEFGFATAPLVSMGCMMMRVCNKDTCPFGIATQNAELRKRFNGKPEYVINFMTFIARQVRELMAKLGFRTVEEMVGRTDRLKPRERQITERAEKIDLTEIISRKYAAEQERVFNPENAYDFRLDKTKDSTVLLKKLGKALENGESKTIKVSVSNIDRTFGTLFGSCVTEKYKNTLPDDFFVIDCVGTGGQSFGAFLPKGVTISLKGDANDSFGKGLSGGKLILSPSEKAKFKPEENIIVGNVALYGATKGEAYINGIAGERFCVRNSGATAVVEGVGDHGLEYMTGGKVVILGDTGKNFAAGMSGGIAYVLDEKHDLYKKLNKSMVSVETVSEKKDSDELKTLISAHYLATRSPLAKRILDNFDYYGRLFKKIVPHDYKKITEIIYDLMKKDLTNEEAELEAFRLIGK